MNKNLIAVALASAVAIPATSMAGDLTVYGQAQVEVSNITTDYDNSGADPDFVDSTTEVADNARGRVGFKATEDLGGKLKGIAKFEFKVDTADGDASSTGGIALTKRELMVGLKGVFGQFEAGRLKTPYKYTGGVKYDPFVATALEARGTAGMSGGTYGHNGFASNLLAWRSPNWGGFTMEATYGLETDDGSYGYAFKWSIPIVEIFLAGISEGDLDCQGELPTANCTPDTYEALKIGGQLRLGGGNHKISLQYEDTDLGSATNNSDPSYIFLGYDGKFGGKTHFVAQLGLKDVSETASGANNSYSETYGTLGAIYKFSKQTRVFGGVELRSDDITNVNNEAMTWTVGIRKDFKS